jgi:D-alanyl-D-alanine carboxypeptidase
MRRIVQVVLVCAGLALPSWQIPAQAANPASTADKIRLAQLERRFQAGLDAICAKYKLPGMTAAYALPDGSVVAFASGLADKESGAKMTVDTRMPAGSVGKTFVAATVIGLAQDGKLSLDDRIERWFGKEPWFDDLPNGREITVRNLLMHRAGISDHIYDPQWIGEAQQMVRSLDTDPDYYFKPAELVKFILKRKPLFPAGQGFKYTDTGYILLGMIIERAGGATYYDQARLRFLEPLKLTLTEPADHRNIPNLAAGYLSPKNPFGLPEKITVDGKLRYNPATEWTGGGLVSNPQDLVRWAKALYEGRALPKPYLAELLTTDPKDKDKSSKYGLGVYVTKSALGDSYGHGGWSVGYLSHVDYYPAQRVAVAVQTNTDVRDDMLGDLMSMIKDVLQTLDKAN